MTAKPRRMLTRLFGARPVRRLASASALWLVLVVVAGLVGALAAGHVWIGLALAAVVLVVGVLIADPMLLVVMALPGALLIQRVGGASTNLSLADLLVFLAGLVCLFQARWRLAHHLKQFMRGVLWYQAVLILVVVVHPFRFNIVDWFHRFSFLAASALVGWVIATEGRTRQAFRLYLAGSSVVALIAMEHAVTLHFQPAQWGVYQKNSIGAILWVAVVIAQINPPWTGIGRSEARVNKYLCLGGLLASQSRQSWILLMLALGLALFLNPEFRGRSKLIVASAVPVAAVLYYSFSVNARNNPKFNSVSIRFDQIGAAIHVWHLSPIFGQGMRFYNLPQFITVTAPPNVVIDNLASTGIVGSLAFVFLVFVTMQTMLRLPRALGTLGLVVLFGHYVDGLFDIFWIGVTSIGPIIIAGVSLGMADLDRLRTAPGRSDPGRSDPGRQDAGRQDEGRPAAGPPGLRSLLSAR
ncbi:MAG: O-antigen ligase family protein [Acidimicrobiales bacterium]